MMELRFQGDQPPGGGGSEPSPTGGDQPPGGGTEPAPVPDDGTNG